MFGLDNSHAAFAWHREGDRFADTLRAKFHTVAERQYEVSAPALELFETGSIKKWN